MRRINRCLNTRLLDICQRTVQLEGLHATLLQYLPDTLKEHCRVGSFNNGCLVLSIEDAARATELRYHLPELRDKLRQQAGIYQLTSIKIAIITAERETTHLTKKTKPLSSAARETITQGGDRCHYLPLKEALHRLGAATPPTDTTHTK